MKRFKVKRNVTALECGWLERTVKKDEIVYGYEGCTYGCISDGVPVTVLPNKTPFFELPENSLEPIL
jgi:hypothetical protein